MVYLKKIGVGACSEEEVKKSVEMGEAGTMFKALMKYLERLAKGE